ncbi:MAG: NAD-dependent epimerase/dehydratase family protein [SAR324 cluster bacterium]|nr:NAD-dependent epimerase/dehydratase family protein [SAR324 cluster bacterium]
MAANILVTGATGFIGSHLVRQLVATGQSVRVLVRNPEKLKDVELEPSPLLEIAKGDLLDPESIEQALKGISRVYHIAGYISTRKQDVAQVYKLNVDITRNLFSVCARHKLEKIVYLASIFALGGNSIMPVDETTEYNLGHFPIGYFKAKREAELYAWSCVSEGLPLTFVYPGFCYGPGDVYNSSSEALLMFLHRRLPVYLTGGANAMDVRDAAQGLILGMEKGRIGEKYLVGGRNISNSDLFDLFSQITRIPGPKLAVPRFAGQWAGKLAEKLMKNPLVDFEGATVMGHYWYYDSSKARKELGFTSRDLRESITDAIHWFCSCKMAPWPPGWKRS